MSKRALLLTGTPILNRPEEIWTQLDALEWHKWGTYAEFKKRYGYRLKVGYVALPPAPQSPFLITTFLVILIHIIHPGPSHIFSSLTYPYPSTFCFLSVPVDKARLQHLANLHRDLKERLLIRRLKSQVLKGTLFSNHSPCTLSIIHSVLFV